MSDPVNKAFTWLEDSIGCELDSQSARAAKRALAEAETYYADLRKEVDRLKSENASLKKQVDSLWVGRRYWDGEDS